MFERPKQDGGVKINMNEIDVSPYLEQWRTRAAQLGLTMEEVDARAEWGIGYFNKILHGVKKPTLPTIVRLCRALELRQEFLPINVARVLEDVESE